MKELWHKFLLLMKKPQVLILAVAVVGLGHLIGSNLILHVGAVLLVLNATVVQAQGIVDLIKKK